MRKRTRQIQAGLGALLALAWAPALFGGAPKAVVATWEELPPLVERREIETVLANGAHIRGRAEKVLPEALEVRVKHSSDPSLVPKGRTRIPRRLVADLTVRWRKGPARALLTIGAWFGAGWLVYPAFEHDGVSNEAHVLALAAAVGGYFLGREIDTKSLHVTISRSPASDGR